MKDTEVQETTVSKERHKRELKYYSTIMLLDIKQIIDDLGIGTSNRGIGVEQECGVVRNSDSRMAALENLVLGDEGDSDGDEGEDDSQVGYLCGVRGGKFVGSYKSDGKEVDSVYCVTVVES